MALIKRSDWPAMGNSLLSDFFDDNGFFNSPWLGRQSMPAVNIKENEKNFEIELAAPGMEKKDFNISVNNGVLIISAEKTQEAENKDDSYTRREFGYSSFSRSFTLPTNTSEDDIKAKYEGGILKVLVAKKGEAQGRQRKSIEIQ
jgi:HSP20 family protein